MYQTPEKFRISGHGVDLTNIEDVELRSILTRASALVDEFCAVPRIPVRYDFRGGVVTDQQAMWDPGSDFAPGKRRLFLTHRPVRSVTQFRIYVTNNQWANFTPNEIFVHPAFLEVTSLAFTSVGLFGAGVLPNIGLMTPMAKVSYTYGYRITVVDEHLEMTDANVWRAQNQFWVSDEPVVVKVNGAEVTPSSIDYEEGTVSIPNVTATTRVTASYTHSLPTAIGEATGQIAAELIGDRALMRKGMHGLVELAVGEVRVRRDSTQRRGVDPWQLSVGPRAQRLLEPYRFVAIAGGS